MNQENNHSFKYWNQGHLEAIKRAQSYAELGEIALEHLIMMPNPITQVCGPISTGGYGSVEKNLEVFDTTIRKLMSNGEIIFNQMPFEWPMQELKKKGRLPGNEANLSVLTGFYLPIFKSGLISRLSFIYGWESSFGARWEHDMTKEFGFEIKYLPRDFHLM